VRFYPYDRFLTFLVSRKVDPGQALSRYGLPYIDRLWVLDCRKRIRDTAPTSVVLHLDSDDDRVLARDGFLDWAEAEGIRSLWEIQPEFGGRPLPEPLNTAFALFINRFSRSVMGLLLLSHVEPDAMIEIVKERLDIGIDQATIGLYTRLFWDHRRVLAKQWPEFTRSLLTKEEQHLITIGYRDQPGLETIRRVLDLKEPRVTEDDALANLIKTAHSRYELALQQPDPESGDAFKWANILLKAVTASNMRQKTHGPEGGGLSAVDLSGLFSVKVTKSQHVSLAELKGKFVPDEPTNKGQ
jgi:hypothetical protein